MSRILLLLVFMIWMSWTPSHPTPPVISIRGDTTVFLGTFALIVLLMGLWSRMLIRRAHPANLGRAVRRFNKWMGFARGAIPVWFAVGLFCLNWKLVVLRLLGPLGRDAFECPDVLLGTLPPFLAWVGLWWSQFPADRALREQNLLIQLDQALPLHAPPGFGTYFMANLRLQLLFTVVPVLLILFTRDLVAFALRPALTHLPEAMRAATESVVMFAAAGVVFLVAPEVLRRVLHTEPLADGPLRRRLDAMCRRHKLGYRDILFWHTQGNMGNAAVMGVLPRLRYVLLSDLLLQTMTDEQIEAVFAHELGHIVHRHMLWYVLFILILLFTLAGPGTSLGNLLPDWANGDIGSAVMMGVGAGLFLLVFGYISRRFERQADVFAARTMEHHYSLMMTTATAASESLPLPADIVPADPSPAAPAETAVGPYGASLFASALHRVAVVNNIPISDRSWCHGSIAKRMRYLHRLSEDPGHTARFDRFMRRLYACLLVVLLVTAGWTLYLARHGMM